MGEEITVYITKYALTLGITRRHAMVCGENTIAARVHGYTNYFHKNEWFESKEDAIRYAEQMRDKKIRATEKKLNTLRGLTWEVINGAT